MQRNTNYHPPALIKEVVKYLHIENQAKYTNKVIDATLGNAGHALEFIKYGNKVLGFDFDRRALGKAEVRLDNYWKKEIGSNNKKPYILVNANFTRITEIAKRFNFVKVDAILFDLGLNQSQQVSQIRGFSFANPQADLDMRINTDVQGVTGADMLNLLSETQLKDLFRVVLKPGESIRLAREIIAKRSETKFITVGDFLEVCEKVFIRKTKVHPATKAFLALRIAVNSELQNLEDALVQCPGLLGEKGRIGVITFHSVEDGLVKKIIKKWCEEGLGIAVTKKPIKPTLEEINMNKLARSAKLRVFEKIQERIPEIK